MGQTFIKKMKYNTWDGDQRPDPVNHKSKTQQFSTKMVIKENILKQRLPRTIQRSFANTEMTQVPNNYLQSIRRP